MVIDDYYAWSGCRSAVDEFVSDKVDVTVEKHARLHLVKAKGVA
jgi:asparagine synthase (glutamine-hydrolysing)